MKREMIMQSETIKNTQLSIPLIKQYERLNDGKELTSYLFETPFYISCRQKPFRLSFAKCDHPLRMQYGTQDNQTIRDNRVLSQKPNIKNKIKIKFYRIYKISRIDRCYLCIKNVLTHCSRQIFLFFSACHPKLLAAMSSNSAFPGVNLFQKKRRVFTKECKIQIGFIRIKYLSQLLSHCSYELFSAANVVWIWRYFQSKTRHR